MRRVVIRGTWAAGCAIALLGCAGDDEMPSSSSGPGITAAGTDDGIDPGSGGGGEKLDLGVGGTAGEDAAGDAGQSDGCKKVDLLFVIDNSGSMEDEQANLIASVPGFIDAMAAELGDTEGYNVGVTTSDLYLGDISCPQEGALITKTTGMGSSNAQCDPYSSGLRFMTEQDDLPAKFGCAAQVGISGDGNERPMQTMLAAVSPGISAPGACNEGFLRDDAILVVVIITDEEDDHELVGCVGMTNVDPQPGSAGEPAQWFDGLVAAKGGNEKSIVVLSLVGPASGDMCPTLDKCTGGITGAEVAQRIITFTEMFTYGFVGPVCQPYGPFFQSAISQIKSACDDFVPQG
jgi:hypothetical protein